MTMRLCQILALLVLDSDGARLAVKYSSAAGLAHMIITILIMIIIMINIIVTIIITT